jgi:hypothetical protein
LYGTEEETALVKTIATSTTANSKAKQAILLEFLLALKGNPKFAPLAEEVVIEDSGIRTFHFFELLVRHKSPDKKQLLNACLIVYSHSCIKKKHHTKPFLEMTKEEQAHAKYEANVVSRMHHQLFKVFGDNAVPYK